MAEFCYECHERLFENPKENSFAGLVQEGQLHFDLCEGCGWGWFDHEGKKTAEPVSED